MLKIIEMLSTCNGDAWHDVLQRISDILSFSSNDKSSFEEDQADVVARRLLSNLCSPVKSIEKRTRKQKTEKTTVMTSSPYTKCLEEKKLQKQNNQKESKKTSK